MKSVKFLHISDLHRGGAPYDDVVGDYKDHSVSSIFAGTLTASMESDFVNAIKQWQYSHGKIDAIVCSGDLGDKGDIVKVKEGVSFISFLQKNLGICEDNVLICPGNHDADRSLPEEKVFDGFSKALSEFGFTNHLLDTTPFFINDIPFLVVNTSLGASEKSLFVQKYKELVLSLRPDEQKRFADELKKAGVKYLEDSLDIPAITNNQAERIIQAISSSESSFVVMIMHHSLFPCNSIEIRPYSSVIDAGRMIEQLIGTENDVLILHGHVHFPSSSVMYKPNGICYVSSVGAGLFNGASGSSVNVIEVICSDEGSHIITVVYEYIKQVNGLNLNKSFSIYSKEERDSLPRVLHEFDGDTSKGISFNDLVSRTGCRENELLKVVLSNDKSFKISRKQSNNVNDWIIHKY